MSALGTVYLSFGEGWRICSHADWLTQLASGCRWQEVSLPFPRTSAESCSSSVLTHGCWAPAEQAAQERARQKLDAIYDVAKKSHTIVSTGSNWIPRAALFSAEGHNDVTTGGQGSLGSSLRLPTTTREKVFFWFSAKSFPYLINL